jgi:anti-sigma regulatory factor (Ser/Thr protein kinase)
MEASAYTQELDRRRAKTARPAVSVGVPAGPDSALAARRALACLRRDHDPELLQKLRQLVSELVTNYVSHSGIEPGRPVDVQVALEQGVVRVTVSDEGKGFLPRPRSAEMDVPGGWGLVLVDQVADRWGVVNDNGSRVWLEIDRRN